MHHFIPVANHQRVTIDEQGRYLFEIKLNVCRCYWVHLWDRMPPAQVAATCCNHCSAVFKVWNQRISVNVRILGMCLRTRHKPRVAGNINRSMVNIPLYTQ